MAIEEQEMKKFSAQYFASMACDLRGLAAVNDVAENYVAVFGDMSADEFDQFTTGSLEASAPYGVLEIDGVRYFVHPLLMLSYEEAGSAANDGDLSLKAADLPESIATLLEAQKEFDPRAIEPIMLGEGSLTAWKLKQPAARVLAQYLSNHGSANHGPDAVDNAMKALLQMTTGGYKPTEMIDYLLGESFVLQEKESIDLLTNLISAMPRWDINGWSPDDLSVKEFGYKVSNAPTAVHVGRNDPCPCGSGKKYKKCCGRFAD